MLHEGKSHIHAAHLAYSTYGPVGDAIRMLFLLSLGLLSELYIMYYLEVYCPLYAERCTVHTVPQVKVGLQLTYTYSIREHLYV